MPTSTTNDPLRHRSVSLIRPHDAAPPVQIPPGHVGPSYCGHGRMCGDRPRGHRPAPSATRHFGDHASALWSNRLMLRTARAGVAHA